MKKSYKFLPLLILVLLLSFTLVGCKDKKDSATINTENSDSKKNEANEEAEAFTVTDMAGNKVDFEKVPSRMVVLLASDVEILYNLGVQDSIIGVGEYCNYPSEALQKQKISTGDDLNMEQIISLQPDVLIMGKMKQTKEQVEQLKNAGIKVITTDAQNIDTTYDAITLLGSISGKTKEAADIVLNMKDEFKKIKDKVKEKESKTIYFEVSPLEYGLWTAGKDTFMQELADIVGLKNVFDDVTGWSEISEEQVLERNPDYIVTVTMYSKDNMTPESEIISRKNWADISAVKNQKVLSDATDMFTRPGPRLVDAANKLYEFVYGE